MTDDPEELTYFTEVLKRLDALRERAPKASLLAEAVTEASEAIDGLVGYFLADNQLPLDSVVEQLREEVHRELRVSLICAKCGHTGEMVRSSGSTTAVSGFEHVRVFRNGTVVAKCQQCRANQAIEAVWPGDPEQLR